MRWAGEMAAVATAACWGVSASIFVTAGRRMGSVVLNRWRLTAATVLLCGTLWALRGSPWPVWASPTQVLLLATSSLLGFVLGDSLYFRALVILGAGKAALLMAMSPLFTALLARMFLHEALGPRAALGMALVLGGLCTVLYGREANVPTQPTGTSQQPHPHHEGSWWTGVFAGATAACLSGGGYILSKLALHDGVDALDGTTIRVATALPIIWIMKPKQGHWERTFKALRDGVATRNMIAGAILGPFVGVTLSLYALQHTHAAVASSIFSCFPLLALALGARYHAERVTLRTIFGAAMSVAGVVILFHRSSPIH